MECLCWWIDRVESPRNGSVPHLGLLWHPGSSSPGKDIPVRVIPAPSPPVRTGPCRVQVPLAFGSWGLNTGTGGACCGCSKRWLGRATRLRMSVCWALAAARGCWTMGCTASTMGCCTRSSLSVLQELAELLCLDLERIRRRPNNAKGCMLMVLLKLSTSRVSATSVSDTAVPAPRGESEGESSEIQALQELWCCRTWPCQGNTRHWRRDLEEATKRYGGTRSYWWCT
jgi:hypothetical protein